MAEQASQTTTIAAPPERVWAIAADFATYPEWAKDVKDVVVLMASRGAVREALRHGVPAATTAQRYFSEVSLPVGEDAALVVVARGERPLDAQRADSRPLAVSAPIYIDRDGDGKVFGR